MNEKPGCGLVLFHTVLVVFTGGLWGIWLVVRHILKNR